MAQDDNCLQAGVEVIDRVAQTAEHVAAQSVAGDANDEQVVGTFAEDQFDWDPGIGAADDRCEGPLLNCTGFARKQAEMVRPTLPRVADIFQTYLRELRPSDLSGSAGLFRLKEEMTRRVNAAISPSQVNAVLFKEVVVQ